MRADEEEQAHGLLDGLVGEARSSEGRRRRGRLAVLKRMESLRDALWLDATVCMHRTGSAKGGGLGWQRMLRRTQQGDSHNDAGPLSACYARIAGGKRAAPRGVHGRPTDMAEEARPGLVDAVGVLLVLALQLLEV